MGAVLHHAQDENGMQLYVMPRTKKGMQFYVVPRTKVGCSFTLCPGRKSRINLNLRRSPVMNREY